MTLCQIPHTTTKCHVLFERPLWVKQLNYKMLFNIPIQYGFKQLWIVSYSEKLIHTFVVFNCFDSDIQQLNYFVFSLYDFCWWQKPSSKTTTTTATATATATTSTSLTSWIFSSCVKNVCVQLTTVASPLANQFIVEFEL